MSENGGKDAERMEAGCRHSMEKVGYVTFTPFPASGNGGSELKEHASHFNM